ncbi:MAG TPA: hypothetical protein VF631_07375 [Allosphingosinicella sp.]|jgi:hypothetical protein|uniref:hypothetical protein n=1 Tax=Allosphingosinicella sp. TaxID=2823234 RepID=UPI002F293C38
MMLPYDALGSAEKALEERVIDTGQWHHQIYVGDDPVSFARSVEKSNAGEPRHEVVEVSQSPLPTALRKTIDWVDANLPKEGTADVLLIPAYALAALWIHGDGQDFVVIAARAPKLRMLPLNRAIPAADFVRRLAENKPIEGMGPVPGADDAR